MLVFADVAEGISNIVWNVYGKITSITKTNGSIITYTYDASGNRISKSVTPAGGGIVKVTIYVRDASGNVMSVYEHNDGAEGTPPTQTEIHLYGSSRLGILNQLTEAPVTVPLTGNFGNANLSTFTRGEKLFELSNHLGNVLVTISDKKIAVQDPNNPANILYYTADVITAGDYAPFGMGLVGRKFTQANSKYRYGFNGKEQDKETIGTSTYDYGFRIYNPALGRFLSVDPLTQKYPWYTPYQFAGNNPIANIDLDGLEGVKATTPGGKKTAALVKTQSTYIYGAIQASNNTNFDQVYAYTQADASVLENEDAFNSLKSLRGRVRGAYGEGVATYITIEGLSERFDFKISIGKIEGEAKKSEIESTSKKLGIGEAFYSLQDAGFDYAVTFRTGVDGFFGTKWSTLTATFQDADGSYDFEVYAGDSKKTFGFEVKTYNPENTSVNMIGFDQAVQKMVGDYYKSGGELNGGKLIPVLQTDEAAWNNAYNKDPDRMQKIYNKLNEVGGKLQLITNLYSGSNDQMQQTKRETNATDY